MQKKTFELLEMLCFHELSSPLDLCRPIPHTPYETMELLWPLNDRFRPLIHQIRTVRYRKQYEREADRALRDFALNQADWKDIPLVIWRVLLERHHQALITCYANKLHRSDATMMHIPEGLSDDAKTRFATVWLCHGMKLPYPVRDESQLDIDNVIDHLPTSLN